MSATGRSITRALIATAEGGRLASAQVELAERFSDPAFVAQFAPGTVGAAYRDFLATTGYSADGLVEVSKVISEDQVQHPMPGSGDGCATRMTSGMC